MSEKTVVVTDSNGAKWHVSGLGASNISSRIEHGEKLECDIWNRHSGKNEKVGVFLNPAHVVSITEWEST